MSTVVPEILWVTKHQLGSLAASFAPSPDPTLFIISNNREPTINQISTTPNEIIDRLGSGLSPDDVVAFIEGNLLKLFLEECLTLLDQLAAYPKALSLLVERKPAPMDTRRDDGPVNSFICKGIAWDRIALAAPDKNPLMLCYTVIEQVLAGQISVDSMLVQQLPCKPLSTPRTSVQIPTVAAIVPHHHTEAYLRSTIEYIQRMASSTAVRCAVGLDVNDTSPYLALKRQGVVDIYSRSSTVAVGPYILRQGLIEGATEELILYQDSDDIPCSNRLVALYEGLSQHNADMIGSHELEVNELIKTIRVYRFPIDVSSVLDGKDVHGVSDNAAEPFLHATALIKRSAFFAAGGLSTNRRIANDSQFLLRASFHLKIANVDEFVYIRRVHKRALTVAPETRNGNNLRKQLSHAWGTDFIRVKRRELPLAESSLAVERASDSPAIYRL